MSPEVVFPDPVSLEEHLAATTPSEDWVQFTTPLAGTTFPLLGLLKYRRPAAPVLCLMPSAQVAGSRRNPVFHRWAWEKHVPEANVIVLSDPTLYASETLLAGWLQNSEVDLTRLVARVVARISQAWGGSNESVLLYGSSMGGFLSLMVAAAAPGMRALAEVPQLDMERYPWKSALAAIERDLLTTTFAEHVLAHPEQVRFRDRCRYEQHVPPFRIITNRKDDEFDLTLDLLREAPQGDHAVTVDVWPRAIGHRVLPLNEVLPILRQELLSPQVATNLPHDTP